MPTADIHFCESQKSSPMKRLFLCCSCKGSEQIKTVSLCLSGRLLEMVQKRFPPPTVNSNSLSRMLEFLFMAELIWIKCSDLKWRSVFTKAIQLCSYFAQYQTGFDSVCLYFCWGASLVTHIFEEVPATTSPLTLIHSCRCFIPWSVLIMLIVCCCIGTEIFHEPLNKKQKRLQNFICMS